MRTLTKQIQLIVVIIFISTDVTASHSYGGLDMCALYPEIMPPGLPAEDLPEPSSQGAKLVQAYCAQCHELPGPGRHTAEEWKPVMHNMLTLMDIANRFGGLMGNINNPNEDEREQIQHYLEQHGLKPIKHTPVGFGGKAFENHCSSCHVLPDPLQYDKKAWPKLLKRMLRNMQVMKYKPPSAEVMLRIQRYLQSVHDTGVAASGVVVAPSSSDASKSSSTLSAYMSRLLALGPLTILIIIGLFRWRRSIHRRPKHEFKA